MVQARRSGGGLLCVIILDVWRFIYYKADYNLTGKRPKIKERQTVSFTAITGQKASQQSN